MYYKPQIVLSYFKEMKLPYCVEEFSFCEGRKFRFDFAWPDYRIALEVEGSVWTQGRHTRGSGFVKDMEKYNEAACLGWRIIRCTPDQVCMMDTVNLIRRALERDPTYPRPFSAHNP